jgi:ATP-binding protein involved in chromosome partitioning
MAVLRGVIDPELGANIVDLGMAKGATVSPDGEVRVRIGLTTAGCPLRAQIQRDTKTRIASLPGVTAVEIDWTELTAEEKAATMAVARRTAAERAPDTAIPGRARVLAVASGKGGVGKSTVATNLALALHRWGAKVAMLDADVFGPSIPQMLGTPQIPAGGTAEKRISPAVYHNMKVMSVAFFVEKADAVVFRGPMVHKLLQQFMEDVDWGEIDYLVVDLPPGTGDVQLSLSQLIPITGAVMVTTPQEVAIIDVVKGISMFKKVEIPILGVVENMSYYVCPACGHRDEIFARGGGRRLAEQVQAPFLGEIPLDAKVRFGGDAGMPVVIGVPDSEHAKIFMELAAKVAGRIVSQVLSGPRRSAALVTIR